MKLFLLILFLKLSIVCFISPGFSQISDTNQLASPFTAGHYLPGLWSVRDFAAPPPGFYLLDHNAYLWGTKFYNIDGNQVTQIDRTNSTVNLNIDMSGYINVVTLFYASKVKMIGARFLSGITAPYSTGNANVAYDDISNYIIDTTIQEKTITGHANGFGDINFTPFGLSWNSVNYDLRLQYSVVAPTGRYTPGGGDNVGLGYWTNMFQLFGYVYPMKKSGKPSKAMAVMTALTYEINGKIQGLNLTPGNRFTVEYGISQYISKKFEIGFMGGNNFQITDDKGSDVWWSPSDLDQLGYVSFQLGYWPFEEKLYTALKYNVDYGLKQRIKSHMVILNIGFTTGWLAKHRKQ